MVTLPGSQRLIHFVNDESNVQHRNCQRFDIVARPARIATNIGYFLVF